MQFKATVTDRVSYALTSQRKITDEGFLIVPGRVARTGIQQYLAGELGLTDREPNAIVNVYRPVDEVFNVDSLASYDGADITIDHPDDFINVDTYRTLSCGVVSGAGTQDADFVLCPKLIIKDKDAVSTVMSGKVQLSAGYSAIYSSEPGKTEDGQDYEFVQREIRINHVALVDRARAGAQARLFDNSPESHNMYKVMLDSGSAVQVADEATATLIRDTIARLTKRATDAEEGEEATKTELAAVEAKVDKLEEDCEEMKEEMSDAAIAKRIDTIVKAKDAARRITGGKATCDSVNITDIQRAALSLVRPKIDWKSKDASYVQAAFDMADDDSDEDDDDKKDKKESGDSQYRQLANDGARVIQKDNTPAPATQAKDAWSQSWKNTVNGGAK